MKKRRKRTRSRNGGRAQAGAFNRRRRQSPRRAPRHDGKTLPAHTAAGDAGGRRRGLSKAEGDKAPDAPPAGPKTMDFRPRLFA